MMPDLANILASTSPQLTGVMSYMWPIAFWSAGVALVGVVGAAILMIPLRIFTWFRPNQQMSGKWEADDKAMKRGGYAKYFDPVSGKHYWKQGQSRVYDD